MFMGTGSISNKFVVVFGFSDKSLYIWNRKGGSPTIVTTIKTLNMTTFNPENEKHAMEIIEMVVRQIAASDSIRRTYYQRCPDNLYIETMDGIQRLDLREWPRVKPQTDKGGVAAYLGLDHYFVRTEQNGRMVHIYLYRNGKYVCCAADLVPESHTTEFSRLVVYLRMHQTGAGNANAPDCYWSNTEAVRQGLLE